MADDLKEQVHILMERGIRPVSAADIASVQSANAATFPVKMARQGLRSGRTAAIAAGLAAAACAAGLVASQLAGTARPRAAARNGTAPVVLTAAKLRHMTSASRIAMAHSGKAVIAYRDYQGGVEDSATEDITFSGRNWNLVMRFPPGSEGAESYVVNRVVNGQAYDYFIANHGLRWYHVTGRYAVSSMHIPDPRLLLRELAPTARFVLAGNTVVNGLRLEQLRATDPRRLPPLDVPNGPNGHLAALTVWVDGHGVVHRMSMTTTQTEAEIWKINPKLARNIKVITRRTHGRTAIEEQLRTIHGRNERIITRYIGTKPSALVSTATVTITFADVGQPQVIRAPAHAITVLSRG